MPGRRASSPGGGARFVSGSECESRPGSRPTSQAVASACAPIVSPHSSPPRHGRPRSAAGRPRGPTTRRGSSGIWADRAIPAEYLKRPVWSACGLPFGNTCARIKAPSTGTTPQPRRRLRPSRDRSEHATELRRRPGVDLRLPRPQCRGARASSIRLKSRTILLPQGFRELPGLCQHLPDRQ